MKKKLNTTLGFYSPSFLRMHVGTQRSLIDLNILNDDFTESVYLHEYCHFIQDLTTSYGLSNLCATVDYMKYANNHIIKLPLGNFNVPIQPILNNTDNVYASLKLFDVYNGSGEDHDVTLLTHRKVIRPVQTISSTLNVECIEVDYDLKGTIKSFEFGALCIVESMAYIIESECYPNCEPSPDLPYLSAEKFVEHVFPQFASDRLNILALCDASLKHFNPGIFFYDTLIKIKSENIVINKPEDIYSICNQASINFNGATSFNSLLTKMSIDAIAQVKGYFNDPRFDTLKGWLENMINQAVDYRLTNEFFPLEIARGGKIKSNKAFASFMKRVGTPLVTNDNGETTLSDPRQNSSTPNYQTIWAIDEIHSVFWGWQKHCDLVELCCTSGINTDYRCSNEPWKRNLDPQCAFGQMWRHWKLSGYIPN